MLGIREMDEIYSVCIVMVSDTRNGTDVGFTCYLKLKLCSFEYFLFKYVDKD